MIANKAFDQGYVAYWDGARSNANPYERGSKEHICWEHGWSHAQFEDDEGWRLESWWTEFRGPPSSYRKATS
jgi:hypothetical protein